MLYNQTVKLEKTTIFAGERGAQVADKFELVNPQEKFGAIRPHFQIIKFEQTDRFTGVATVVYNDRKIRLSD